MPLKSVAIACSVLLCLAANTFAQNLESIGKENPISLSGGVSLNQIVYGVNGIESRRDPYTYFASGNLNLSLYGWSVPISFSLSNQNTSFQQPFNQYSIHPTYKAVTAHIGYNSMSFSPYTVNGHIFLGAGLDVTPAGKWRVSGMYGRFLKHVAPAVDTAGVTNTPAFDRFGYGFKGSYGSGNNLIEIILFHAEDDIRSIPSLPDSLDVKPEENIVASIGFSKSIFENIIFKGEVASSAVSIDSRAEESTNSNPLSGTDFLFTPRASTSYYNAYKAGLMYQGEGYSFGAGYERIDPEFRTHGAYFFNKDLESITLNGALATLQGRMNIAANMGTQRDNLDGNKISTMKRMVGSLNVGYTPSQKLNINASYSNFQTYTNIRSQFVDINQLTPYDNLDTLNFTQVSQNATLTAMYMLGQNPKRRQTLNANLTAQDAADKQAGVPQNSGTRFYNMNVGYGVNMVPQNLMLSFSFNASVNDNVTQQGKTLGPTASVSKSFFEKKLRTTFSTSYNTSYSNNLRVNTIVNGRVNASLSVKKKHNINASTVLVRRATAGEGSAKSFTEFTGTLGYSYSFGIN